MVVNYKKLDSKAFAPTQGTQYSAGFDLYALGQYEIVPHETTMIHTGIAMSIPQYFFGAVFARSGLAAKQGLRPANCVGVIDSDYRGELIVALHNDSATPRVINNGDRVAQLVILPCPRIELEESESLDDTVRGAGGFGSTGVALN